MSPVEDTRGGAGVPRGPRRGRVSPVEDTRGGRAGRARRVGVGGDSRFMRTRDGAGTETQRASDSDDFGLAPVAILGIG